VSAKSNLTASIRDRLLSRAKADKIEFQQMLTRFASPRSISRYFLVQRPRSLASN
jgi:hypothetical protein